MPEEYLLNISANRPKWSAQNTQGPRTTYHKVSEEMASLIEAQFATKRKSAPETESSQNENQPSVVSSADGAKILKNRFYYS